MIKKCWTIELLINCCIIEKQKPCTTCYKTSDSKSNLVQSTEHVYSNNILFNVFMLQTCSDINIKKELS